MTDSPAEGRWPLVMVRWLDSSAPRGWQPMAEWQGAGSLACVSVGFLFARDETAATVIPHFAYPDDDRNRQGSGIMVIPAGAIVSINELRIESVCEDRTASASSCSASAHSSHRS